LQRRKTVDVVGGGDLAGDADDELQLLDEADLRL